MCLIMSVISVALHPHLTCGIRLCKIESLFSHSPWFFKGDFTLSSLYHKYNHLPSHHDHLFHLSNMLWKNYLNFQW